jgi:hypothetical protein
MNYLKKFLPKTNTGWLSLLMFVVGVYMLFKGHPEGMLPAATIGNTFPTLVDVIKRLNPTGGVDSVVEALARYNPILDDVPWTEGNLTTGHRFTSRTSLPTITWRRLNQGVDPTKSTTDQTDETCGMMECYSKVDVDLAELNGNTSSFRASEDNAFLQAFNIEFVNALFYYSVTVNPERIQGLTPRLNATAGNPAAAQIIKADAGAAGANQTSIWLLAWSPEVLFGIYPKGSMGGFVSRDLGEQLVLDSNNKQFLAWVTRYQWKCGIAVRDFRFISRICNIDVTRWKEDLSAGADLAMRMMDAIAAIFKLDVANPVFYMNRATFGMLNKQLVKRQANWLEWITVTPSGQGAMGQARGQRIPAFMGIPIKIVDGLLSTESVVV